MKARLSRTVIRPVTLYGCELWTLTKTEEQKVEILQRKILRRKYGEKKVGEMWTRRNNKEVMEMYSYPSIISEENG